MYDPETYDGEMELDQYEGEYEGEYDPEYDGEMEQEGGYDESEAAFSAAEEMELAAELLTVSDEAELEQFLGKLIKKAWSGVKKFAGSPTGRALGGLLKGAAKKALPVVGRAVGSYIGGPAGGAAGARLASSAGRIFGLEFEGMSPEDMEFETARRFVRFAGSAAQKATTAPRSTPPVKIAKAALTAAARAHAPGLLRPGILPSGAGRPLASHPSRFRRRTGRWIRRGTNLIVLGA
jgi:hypothetical protein